MTVLGDSISVTGAGGFIGRSLVRALLAEGFHVQALAGAPGHVFPVLPDEVLSLTGDIEDKRVLARLCKGASAVIHLAGPAGVRTSFEEPETYARVHVTGTAALLKASLDAGVRRFVYISSAEVYGRPMHNPVDEDQPPRARSPYAAAKVGAEQLIHAFTQTYELEAVILRPFSVYGPGQSPHGLIGTILEQLRSGVSITLNDLRPIRDYVFVADLVDAIRRAVTTKLDRLVTANIGSGRGISVLELAKTILEITGNRLPIREHTGARRPGRVEILELVADIAEAETLLGWSPRVSLRDGLQKTIRDLNR